MPHKLLLPLRVLVRAPSASAILVAFVTLVGSCLLLAARQTGLALYQDIANDGVNGAEVIVAQRLGDGVRREAERGGQINGTLVGGVESGERDRLATPVVLQEMNLGTREESCEPGADVIHDGLLPLFSAALAQQNGTDLALDDVEVLDAARMVVRRAEAARLEAEQHLRAAAVGELQRREALTVGDVLAATGRVDGWLGAA